MARPRLNPARPLSVSFECPHPAAQGPGRGRYGVEAIQALTVDIARDNDVSSRAQGVRLHPDVWVLRIPHQWRHTIAHDIAQTRHILIVST